MRSGIKGYWLNRSMSSLLFMQYAGYELKGHLTNWETGLLRNPQNGIMTC